MSAYPPPRPMLLSRRQGSLMEGRRPGGQFSSPGRVTSAYQLMLQGTEVPQGHGQGSAHSHAQPQATLLTSNVMSLNATEIDLCSKKNLTVAATASGPWFAQRTGLYLQGRHFHSQLRLSLSSPWLPATCRTQSKHRSLASRASPT